MILHNSGEWGEEALRGSRPHALQPAPACPSVDLSSLSASKAPLYLCLLPHLLNEKRAWQTLYHLGPRPLRPWRHGDADLTPAPDRFVSNAVKHDSHLQHPNPQTKQHYYWRWSCSTVLGFVQVNSIHTLDIPEKIPRFELAGRPDELEWRIVIDVVHILLELSR